METQETWEEIIDILGEENGSLVKARYKVRKKGLRGKSAGEKNWLVKKKGSDRRSDEEGKKCSIKDRNCKKKKFAEGENGTPEKMEGCCNKNKNEKRLKQILLKEDKEV